MGPLITLTTDFGDGAYVAQMKGVILSLMPEARLVDVTHHVGAGDVREGAYLLECTVPAFPEESVHLAVVDPGVGTERRALAVRFARRTLLGPDNGLLTAFLGVADEIREITAESLFLPEVSPTFHGRDIFAPVAVHLAAGAALASVGPELLSPPVTLPELRAEGSEGLILHVDRFGNLITSFPSEILIDRPDAILTGPEGAVSQRAVTFGEAEPGVPFLYSGSGGRLEVAVAGGSAAKILGWGRGAELGLVDEA
jgi:S-adenosyl-L-methionine hydrolase (adenosine-forming)